jgi:TolB protein
MSDLIEDRLRDAYQAKTAQLTEQRLDQFAAAREYGVDQLLVSEHTAELPVLDFAVPPSHKRQHRWAAPVLAAATVAAVAIGVTAVTGIAHESKPKPNPPASHVSTPPPSSSAPSPSASASGSQTVAALPYLPAGQTGNRSQVPWSTVGSGWRLLAPHDSAGRSDGTLYLYDPVGGRYLLSDRLSESSRLLAWSPDGSRALMQSGNADAFRYQEVDLHTGELSAGFSVPLSGFVSYTRPKGLALLIAQTTGNQKQLVRYGTEGALEHVYAAVPGVGSLTDDVPALYLPDGSQFVDSIVQGPMVLVGNDGHLVRSYQQPVGYDGCMPLKWWSTGTILERCERIGSQSPFDALYLQPVAGGAPSLLTDDAGDHQMGHWGAWRLSNGDVLLANTVGCGEGGYQVLGSDGVVRPLRLPTAIIAPGWIVNLDGDQATFLQSESIGCGGPGSLRGLVDYNLVTGQTRRLLDGGAVIVSWPGDPS